MLEMIRGCQCQQHIEIREICVAAQGSSRSKMSALLAVLKSKARRPSTFGSWLEVRVGSAGCVGDIFLSVSDLFLLNPSLA